MTGKRETTARKAQQSIRIGIENQPQPHYLALPLLVTRFYATNNANNTLAANNFTVSTDRLY
tara:strand:+ start:35 stop:220 length:186 start_codon:yes stop_codon:yes gene_type:complete